MDGSRLIGLLGVATMVLLSVLLSYDRKSINWRRIAGGLGALAGLAVLMLKTGAGQALFSRIGMIFNALLRFQEQGARFVFGNLVQPDVAVGIPGPGGAFDASAGFVLRTGADVRLWCRPDHHLPLGLDGAALLCRHHDPDHEGHWLGPSAQHQDLRGRDPGSGGQHFPWCRRRCRCSSGLSSRDSPSRNSSRLMVVGFATASSAVTAAVRRDFWGPSLPGVGGSL